MSSQEKVLELIERSTQSQKTEAEEFLEHYGKKGMKWGVRKARTGVRTSSDYKKTAPLRNRKTRELSNKQIQSVNARINMEQQYKRLNPTKMQVGHNVVKGILGVVGTVGTIYGLSQTPHGKAAISAGRSFVSKIPKRALRSPPGQLKLF